MSDSSLKQKCVVIIGGSSGIGLAVARAAARAGADILVVSRQAGERQDELAATVGPNVRTFSADIRSGEQVERLLGELVEFDHLVITVRPELEPSPFMQVDPEAAKEAFETKFWAPYRLIQRACTRIRPGGGIVLTSGIAGERIYRGSSTMALINSAVETLCRSLAVELAPIRVNAVSPGFVAPKPVDTREYASGFPAGRLATTDEVADAYVALMTTPYVTGTSLTVDGGARLI